jgi:transcriptional regulator with XRE-family HTH domain
LGYLSEVERGQKEASSELLAAICRALGVQLSEVLRDVTDELHLLEPVPSTPTLVPVSSTLGGSARDTDHEVVAAA